MALYINLYHEIQKQKLKRQRDPLKIAIAGSLLVAVGFIAYYFWRLESVVSLQREASSVKAEWFNKLEPKAKEADALHDEYEENIKLADVIVHKMENRFYWAPLIEQILQIVPPEIQVTGFDGAMTSDGTKKVTLTLSGVATGPQPRAVAEELRVALQNKLAAQYRQPTAVFNSLEDGVETVQYQGKNSPTALFVINLNFTSPDIDDTAISTKTGEKK